MTTPLVYALLAGVLLIAVVLGIRRVRRKPAARRPAVSTTTAAKRRSATAGKPRPAPEPARHDAGNTDGPSGGMQVDEPLTPGPEDRVEANALPVRELRTNRGQRLHQHRDQFVPARQPQNWEKAIRLNRICGNRREPRRGG